MKFFLKVIGQKLKQKIFKKQDINMLMGPLFQSLTSFFFFFKIPHIYLRDTERVQARAEAEGEADSSLNREPNAELDSRTLGL